MRGDAGVVREDVHRQGWHGKPTTPNCIHIYSELFVVTSMLDFLTSLCDVLLDLCFCKNDLLSYVFISEKHLVIHLSQNIQSTEEIF